MEVRLIVDVHEGEFIATISNCDERKGLPVGDFLLDIVSPIKKGSNVGL